MIWAYLKESLHWLRLALFKPVTLREDVTRMTREQKRSICLKIFPVGLVLILTPPAVAGFVYGMVGVPFDWAEEFSKWLFLGPLIWLGGGVSIGVFAVERSAGPRVDLVALLVSGLLFGTVIGHIGGLVIGLEHGLEGGLSGGLGIGAIMGLMIGLTGGSAGNGLIVGLGMGIIAGLVRGIGEGFWLCAGYAITFPLFFFRPFHLLPHLIQYWRSGASRNPIVFFRNSPVHWDEAIGMPLPFLSDWLVKLTRADREQGLAEISFVAGYRPSQRRAAYKAMLAVTDDL